MIKQKNNVYTYRAEGKKGAYIVTLERLNNDYNGNPRFKAILTKADFDKSYYSKVYTFTGHFCGDEGEVDFIISYYEKSLKD